MKLVAFTTKLSISNFIGTDIGTKVEVITKEEFFGELNTPNFRGAYLNTEPEELDILSMLKDNIDKTIADRIVILSRVFNWTHDYTALYYIEYKDVPDSITPPAYLRITRLDNTLKITEENELIK